MLTLQRAQLTFATGIAVLAAGTFMAANAMAASTVKIGLSVPLTGVQAGLGKEAESVWRAFAKHANSKQLAGAYTFELAVLDDAFDSAKSKANAEQLLGQGVAVMVGTAGIPPVQIVLPLLEARKVPLLGPGSGSLALRGKSPALFHVKASFGAEVDQMARLLSTMGLKKVVVITDDASDRKALVERFAAALAGAGNGGGSSVKAVVIAQQGGATQEAVAQAMEAQPEAVYVMTIPGLAGGVLKQLRGKNYKGFLAAWSVAATGSVVEELGSAGAGIIFGTVMPSPTSALSGIKASFRAFANEQGVKPSYRAMEIYITGRILAEALARADGSSATGSKVWTALESLRDVSIDGWRVRYLPTDRDGSKFVDTMMLMADGKFR